MNRLFIYVRRYWWWYALSILCTLIFAVLQMVIPLLVRDATDAVRHGATQTLSHIALLMCGLAVAMGVARCFSRLITFNTGRNIEYDLRNDLFAHLVKLDPAFYERIKTGDLMSRMI